MRRNDRAVTEPNRIDEIIRACDCCRLGFADGEESYIVPLNFGFCWERETRVFLLPRRLRGTQVGAGSPSGQGLL